MPLDELNNSPVSTADWPAIDRALLGEARPAAPSFPLHLLPGRWKTWVEAAARPFGSADYLANCLLAAVAGVGGAGIRISVTDHWDEPLLLWQALLGGPSSGRSAAFARVRGLLEAVKPWEEDDDRGKPRVVIDGALRHLDMALWRSARGAVLWRSDLADWMDEASQRADRPAWLAAWTTEDAMVRAGEEKCVAVGILGALSPDRLTFGRLAPGFIDGDSALAARFLYVWPEPAGLPSLGGAEADDAGLVALLQKIANFAGDRRTPGYIPLDDAAIRRLEELLAELRARADATDGVEAEWLAKGVSTIVRLAGLLALMQRAEVEPEPDYTAVELGHLEAAHALWSGYYRPQAQAVFDRGGVVGCERRPRGHPLAPAHARARNLARGRAPSGTVPDRHRRRRRGRSGAPRGGRRAAAAGGERLDQGRPAPAALGGSPAIGQLAQLALGPVDIRDPLEISAD